jgi:SAM-dependent methyltransferase
VASTTFFPKLVDAGRIVATTDITSEFAEMPVGPRGAPWTAVLEHERIPFVSYPYEWSFAMLRDAALCQLEVLRAALSEDLTLKDGTAYNVQFTGVTPRFIDIGSFAPAGGPWVGYRQFCQMMLFPLMIQAHLGVAFQPLLRGSLEGIDPATVSAMFSGRNRFHKGVLTNISLHALADRRVKGDSQAVAKKVEDSGLGANLADATAGKLQSLIEGLDVGTDEDTDSTWNDYRTTCSYSEADNVSKRAFVTAALETVAPASVVDLGANDGAYARLAGEHAQRVVAVDFDHVVIDRLYRELSRDKVTNIIPLVMNLVDPSPGLGWRGAERQPFEARIAADVDLVFSLALIHHLAISANVPLGEIVQWLADFGADVVVEFVHRDDPMTKRLLAQKPDGLFDDYNLENFEGLLGQTMKIERREELPGGTRTMFLASPPR